MASQVNNGNGFEYAIAHAFHRKLGCGIGYGLGSKQSLAHLQPYERAYASMADKDRNRADGAADKITDFLILRDKRLSKATALSILGSKLGKQGDVRDIVITCHGAEIGISAKYQNDAVKHSRLSGTIDFGTEWGGQPVSDSYWGKVRPIFDDLREKESEGQLWRDMPDKMAAVYVPVLSAFQHELARLAENHGTQFVARFFHYLIGHQDFYKVLCYNKESIIESVNINGTLNWGNKWKIPDKIQSVDWKEKSQTTLIVTFEGGWSVSFRIHSASSRIEPSLKFDIKFEGFSKKVSKASLAHED